jgi:hypothetical protein
VTHPPGTEDRHKEVAAEVEAQATVVVVVVVEVESCKTGDLRRTFWTVRWFYFHPPSIGLLTVTKKLQLSPANRCEIRSSMSLTGQSLTGRDEWYVVQRLIRSRRRRERKFQGAMFF